MNRKINQAGITSKLNICSQEKNMCRSHLPTSSKFKYMDHIYQKRGTRKWRGERDMRKQIKRETVGEEERGKEIALHGGREREGYLRGAELE